MSTPMPRCRPAAIATLILVPTPSALAASRLPSGSWYRPANGPTPAATCAPWVAAISGLTLSSTRSYASMSTPAAAYDSPSDATLGDDWSGRFELEFVHLELLRHGDRVRAVEARAAELLRRAAADGTHEARDGQVRQAVGAYVAAHLLDGTARCDELLGRADVDAHEARKAHGRARDPHVDLLRPRCPQPVDDATGRGAADDGVVDGDQTLAPDGARQRVELQHHARLAQRLVGLDERAVDVAAFHQRLAIWDAGGFGVSDCGRGAAVRERDHHVRLDRRFLGQLMTHPDARLLELAVLEDGVGTREVDELEHAHRVLVGRLERGAVHAVLVHHDHLARLILAHEGRVHSVERARLRRHRVCRLAGEGYESDAQRPEAERVAQRDELVGRDDAARVRADHAGERAPHDLLPRPAMRVLDEARHHLGVEPGLERRALLLELDAQCLRVQQVAVVGDSARTELRVMERQRVRVLRARRAGGRVPGVAERDHRALAHLLHRRRVEHLRDQAHAAMHTH